MKMFLFEPRTVDYKIYKLGYVKVKEDNKEVRYEKLEESRHLATVVIIKRGKSYSIEKIIGYKTQISYNEEFDRKEFLLFLKKVKKLMKEDKHEPDRSKS